MERMIEMMEVMASMIYVTVLSILAVTLIGGALIGAYFLFANSGDAEYRIEMADHSMRTDTNCSIVVRTNVLACSKSDYSLSSIISWKRAE